MLAALLVPLVLLQAPAPPPSEPAPSIRDGSAQRRLDDARERWRDTGIKSYRFRLTRQCFCPRAAPVLRVRKGRPVDAPRDFRNVATVPRLFRLVQSSIDDEVAGLRVRYGKRGVPRSIFIDGRTYVADDEVGYEVDRFRRAVGS